MFRNGRITFRETPVMAVALEMSSVARDSAHGSLSPETPTEMYRKAAAGEGLMVSDNLAQLQHLTLGDILEIAAPYGMIRLPIVGIIVDYSDQQGHDLDGSERVRQILAGRLGERFPRLCRRAAPASGAFDSESSSATLVGGRCSC